MTAIHPPTQHGHRIPFEVVVTTAILAVLALAILVARVGDTQPPTPLQQETAACLDRTTHLTKAECRDIARLRLTLQGGGE